MTFHVKINTKIFQLTFRQKLNLKKRTTFTAIIFSSQTSFNYVDDMYILMHFENLMMHIKTKNYN